MYKDGTCLSTTAADGTVTREACPDAFGMVLGTSIVCSFLEMLLSFAPARTLQRVFPPLVTGWFCFFIVVDAVFRRDSYFQERSF